MWLSCLTEQILQCGKNIYRKYYWQTLWSNVNQGVLIFLFVDQIIR